MGIVLKQSFLNTLILFAGFAIGGINVLFLFTHFLHDDYFGLITFLLSTANIILPLFVFGMQFTVIKFYSSYKTKQEKDGFLISTLIIPLTVIIPLAIFSAVLYENIANWLSSENILIKKYTYLIFWIALFMGYFEVFYSWTKVQMNSVFGNFMKEMFSRIATSFLLVAVYFKWISDEEFIYSVAVIYALRMVIMKIYALYVYKPEFIFKIPANIKELLSFSFYMIVAGSAAGVLLEIDKFMIPQMEQIAQVAYYSVGVYIASVIAIPTRAMQQITTSITAKSMNENNMVQVENLYKQTSINLLVTGGLLFLLINLNIGEVYEIINKPEYTKGIKIVMIISLAKMVELALGTGNAILVNSKYYKIFFYMSLAMAISVVFLNQKLISIMGITGAAVATLIVVIVYSLVKIGYLKANLKIQPFSIETIKVLLIITGVYFIFSYLNLSFSPFLNVIVKSLLVTVVYILLIKMFKISKELELLLKRK